MKTVLYFGWPLFLAFAVSYDFLLFPSIWFWNATGKVVSQYCLFLKHSDMLHRHYLMLNDIVKMELIPKRKHMTLYFSKSLTVFVF